MTPSPKRDSSPNLTTVMVIVVVIAIVLITLLTISAIWYGAPTV